MPTYTGYTTPEEFDAGYDNFITPEVVKHWDTILRRESAEVLARLPVQRDVRYGSAARNVLDFFPAANAREAAPTLIAIHGGLWFLFDKLIMHFLAPAFTARGVNVACLNYTLAPGAGLGQIVSECRAATHWLYERADKFGIDRRRLSVLGHSAAGQLCTLVASTDWPALSPVLPKQILRHVIGVSGFYDIEPFAGTHFHAFTQFPAEDYQDWNPLRHVSPHLPPATLITGAKESSLLQQMMAHYARALEEAGVPVTTTAVPGEDHFSVLHEIGNSASPLFEKMLAEIT